MLKLHGWSSATICQRDRPQGNHASSLGPVIEKPFTVEGLLGKIREVLAQGSGAL